LDDFERYLRTVGEPYRFLHANRPREGERSGERRREGRGEAEQVEQAELEGGNGAHDATRSPAAAHRLSVVPPVVFGDHFELTDPCTFEVFSPEGAPAATMVMIEKLANYLDQVELTLLSEVSSRAEGFFEALASYDRLSKEVEAGIQQIASMRARLRELETNLVRKPLHLPRLTRRRANVQSLHEKLRLMLAVVRTQPTIQQLISAADFPAALELIASSQQLLATELAGVAALSPISEGLVATNALIEATMCRDFLELALGYDPDGPPPSAPTEAIASELTMRLAPLATGLFRLHVLDSPLSRLAEAMKKELKGLPKRVLQSQLARLSPPLPEGGDEGGAAEAAAMAANGAEEKGKGPLAQLKALELDAFEDVMGRVGAAILVLLRRAAAVGIAIRRALEAAAAPVDTPETMECEAGAADDAAGYVNSLNEQGTELLRSLAELAAERFARYLRCRSDAHSRLPLASFKRVCALADDFGGDVAHLAGSPCHIVTAEVAAQASSFIEHIHTDASKKLEAIIDQEQWAQVDVPIEFQTIVDAFCNNETPPHVQPPELPPPTSAGESDADAASPGAPIPAKEIVLAGAGYKVVGSALILLSTIAHYIRCATGVSATTTAVAHVLPALLRLYHTRAYKQVLMAGAMLPTSAGLKSISFKHLALSSQCLGVVLALTPHLKAILTAYLSESHRHLLNELDAAASDLAAHQQQIFAKFVSILEERRRGRMKDISDNIVPVPGSCKQPEPSSNIRAVANDLRAVHKTLRDLLTRQQLHELFAQILDAYDAGLLEAYKAVDTSAAYTRQCIVQDVQHLRKEVTKLHFSLPNGCCPQLVAYALALPVA